MLNKSSLPKLSLLTVVLPATLVLATGDGVRAEEATIKDASVHTDRPTKLDFTGSLGFFGDVDIGAAAWFSFPLVPDGFIPPINDSFNLELGVAMDYAWVNYGYVNYACDFNYYGFAPIGGVRWDFYMNRSWTLFAKAKVGVGYRVLKEDCGPGFNDSDYGHVYPAYDGGVGAFWNFSSDMAMRFDVGSRGAAVGISINM